jgi:hypothetical protein
VYPNPYEKDFTIHLACPLHANPLLKEKRDFGSQALISNISDPALSSRRAIDLDAPFALADNFIAQISRIG